MCVGAAALGREIEHAPSARPPRRGPGPGVGTSTWWRNRDGSTRPVLMRQMHTISDMTPDEYLQTILAREQVDTGPFHAVRGMQTTLLPIIRQWAGGYLVNLHPSGSFAKGTANRSGTDIDLFISLHQNTPHTLSEVYSNLQSYLEHYGYTPRRQNVSLNIRVNGYSVDLVPAKHQDFRAKMARSLILTTDIDRFTARRARLAPAMIYNQIARPPEGANVSPASLVAIRALAGRFPAMHSRRRARRDRWARQFPHRAVAMVKARNARAIKSARPPFRSAGLG